MKTIFITGSSSGLGKETAKLFAKKGWKVIATMRKPEIDKELKEFSNIDLLALDVTNEEQIKKIVENVVSNYDVDIVFNNAGYGLAGPFEGTSDEQIVNNITTNLLGVMRVTKAFIPYFRANKKGIFITTTSIGGTVTMPMNSVYHATKFALEGWSESLSYELEPFGINVKTIAPGGIMTDFSGRSLDIAQHDSYKESFEKITSVFKNPDRHNNYSTPEYIASIVYQAATDNKNQLKYIAGNDANQYFDLRNSITQDDFRKEIKKIFLE